MAGLARGARDVLQGLAGGHADLQGLTGLETLERELAEREPPENPMVWLRANG